MVEGPSDFIFMNTTSDHLKSLGRTGLDKRWSIMPLGGADVIPAFVALLGNHLDVTVVVDACKEGHQKLSALAKAGLLTDKRIITIGDVAGRKVADIEDLFAKDDYLALYNAAFGKSVKAVWPAAGSVDTELRCLMELEGSHAETEVQPRVQA